MRTPALKNRHALPYVNHRGFTLVELLVVVVIIVALAAIAVPIFLNQKEKAQDGAAEAELAKVTRYLTQGTAVGLTIATGPVPSTVPGLGALEAPYRLSAQTLESWVIFASAPPANPVKCSTGKQGKGEPRAPPPTAPNQATLCPPNPTITKTPLLRNLHHLPTQ